MGNTSLTYEGLTTVLVQIEAQLNSRLVLTTVEQLRQIFTDQEGRIGSYEELRKRQDDDINQWRITNQTDNRLHKEKAKAFKKKHENLSMFGGILLLAALNITELKGPGYLISHDKTLLEQTWQFNFRLQTNVNLTEDLKRIRHI